MDTAGELQLHPIRVVVFVSLSLNNLVNEDRSTGQCNYLRMEAVDTYCSVLSSENNDQ